MLATWGQHEQAVNIRIDLFFKILSQYGKCNVKFTHPDDTQSDYCFSRCVYEYLMGLQPLLKEKTLF